MPHRQLNSRLLNIICFTHILVIIHLIKPRYKSFNISCYPYIYGSFGSFMLLTNMYLRVKNLSFFSDIYPCIGASTTGLATVATTFCSWPALCRSSTLLLWQVFRRMEYCPAFEFSLQKCFCMTFLVWPRQCHSPLVPAPPIHTSMPFTLGYLHFFQLFVHEILTYLSKS